MLPLYANNAGIVIKLSSNPVAICEICSMRCNENALNIHKIWLPARWNCDQLKLHRGPISRRSSPVCLFQNKLSLNRNLNRHDTGETSFKTSSCWQSRSRRLSVCLLDPNELTSFISIISEADTTLMTIGGKA